MTEKQLGNIYIDFSKRNGVDYCFYKTCTNLFNTEGFPHARGFYIQIGQYGGHILWKSNVCYEK